MKKFLLIPAIVLLVCCVTVGAFNAVSGQKNRPMTLMESLEEIASIEYSLDDMSDLLDDISSAWSDEPSTYPSGGSVGGRFPKPEDTHFGGKLYESNSGEEWIDTLLNGLSDFVYTVATVVQLLLLFIQDTFAIVSTLFNVMVKFFVGVPT